MNDGEVLIYALVVFRVSRPTKVVVWFESRVAAMRYAQDEGFEKFSVSPVEFDAGRQSNVLSTKAIVSADRDKGESDDKSEAALSRRYAEELLNQDGEFDGTPVGDPPLLASDYRRALYGVLALEPRLDHEADGPVNDGEAAAFRLGYKAMIDRLHIAVGEAWSPERLEARERRRQSGRPKQLSVKDKTDEGSNGEI
jgi:hypothetical protein